jgi:hypothetical protein
MSKTTCRGCGAEIEWVKTQNGASMPVNPEYVEIDIAGAKTTTIVTDDGKVESGSLVNRDTLFPPTMEVKGRISHFATCPQAGRFRR